MSELEIQVVQAGPKYISLSDPFMLGSPVTDTIGM